MANLKKLYDVEDVEKMARVIMENTFEYSVHPLNSNKYLITCGFCGHHSTDDNDVVSHDEDCLGLIAKTILENEES